jgi:hypothetical protein
MHLQWTNQKKSKNQSFKIIFAVRRHETHDKDTSVPCIHVGRTAKANDL